MTKLGGSFAMAMAAIVRFTATRTSKHYLFHHTKFSDFFVEHPLVAQSQAHMGMILADRRVRVVESNPGGLPEALKAGIVAIVPASCSRAA